MLPTPQFLRVIQIHQLAGSPVSWADNESVFRPVLPVLICARAGSHANEGLVFRQLQGRAAGGGAAAAHGHGHGPEPSSQARASGEQGSPQKQLWLLVSQGARPAFPDCQTPKRVTQR